MKKHLPLLLTSLALLASCAAPSVASSSPSGEAYGDSSEASNVSNPDGSVTSNVKSGDVESGWAEEEEALMKELLGVVLPYFDMTDYQVAVEQNLLTVSGNTELTLFEINDLFKKAGLDSYFYEADEQDPAYVAAYLTLEGYSYIYIEVYPVDGDETCNVVLQASLYEAVENWPSAYILETSDFTGIDSLPEFPADAYVSYITEDEQGYNLYIECYGENLGEDPVADYAAILTKAGYELDEYYALFGADVYVNSDGINISLAGSDSALYIAAWYEAPAESDYLQSETFPAEDVASFLSDTLGVKDVTIPSYQADLYYHQAYIEDTAEDSSYEILSYYDTEKEAEAIETAYADALDKAGWKLDYSSYDEDGIYANDPSNTVEILFWYWIDEDDNPYFCEQIYLGQAPEMAEEHYDLAVKGEQSSMTFDDESGMVVKGADMSKWNNGAFSFIVEKGSATQDVGNGSFYSNPLRTYAGQTITIHAEIEIASITIDATGKSADSVPSFSAPSVGTWDGLTLNLPEGGAKDVTFSVSTGQARFSGITVTFVA